MKNEWQTVTLSDICEKASSNISQNTLKNETGKYPIYGASGLIKNINFYQQEKPYIGIVKDGAGVGRVFRLPGKSSVIGTLQYLIPKSNVLLDFLYYFILSIDFNKHKNGSTIPHIYFKDYAREELLLPPLPEQKQIVEILDEAFAGIEKAKGNAYKKVELIKETFNTFLNEELVRSCKNSKIVELQEITEVKDGTHDSPKYVDEGVPFITQKNIHLIGLNFNNIKYIKESDHEKFYKRSNASIGDILISMIGANRGMACVIEDNRVFSIKNVGLIKKCKNLDPYFLLYYLRNKNTTKYFSDVSKGGAQEFIGLTQLRKIPVPIIEYEKQMEIRKKITCLEEETNLLKQKQLDKLFALDELKQSILPKAFSGELTRRAS